MSGKNLIAYKRAYTLYVPPSWLGFENTCFYYFRAKSSWIVQHAPKKSVRELFV